MDKEKLPLPPEFHQVKGVAISGIDSGMLGSNKFDNVFNLFFSKNLTKTKKTCQSNKSYHSYHKEENLLKDQTNKQKEKWIP